MSKQEEELEPISELDHDDIYTQDKRYYIEGKKAFKNELTMSSCPYRGRAKEMWLMGWNYNNAIGNI